MTSGNSRRPPLAAIAVALLLGWTAAAAAQDTPSPPAAPAPATLTGKERLTGKAADEQRVDDCNVPPERRTRPRPTACPWDSAQPSN